MSEVVDDLAELINTLDWELVERKYEALKRKRRDEAAAESCCSVS